VGFLSLTQPRTFAYATLRTLDKARLTSRLSRTAQPGERYPIQTPVAEIVYADLRRRSAVHDTTVSRLAADLIAIIAGHPELACKFGPVTVCLPCRLAAVISRPGVQPARGTRIRTEVFIPGPVYTVICGCATRNACSVEHIAADLLAIATGHAEGVRHLGQAEVRRLASESLAAAVDGAPGASTRCA
jgi:hypothetical protein